MNMEEYEVNDHASMLGASSGKGDGPRHPYPNASGSDEDKHGTKPKIPPEPPKPPDINCPTRAGGSTRVCLRTPHENSSPWTIEMKSLKPHQTLTDPPMTTHGSPQDSTQDILSGETYEIPDLDFSLLTNATPQDNAKEENTLSTTPVLVSHEYYSPSHPTNEDTSSEDETNHKDKEENFFDNNETQSDLKEIEMEPLTPIPSKYNSDETPKEPEAPKEETTIATMSPFMPRTTGRAKRKTKYIRSIAMS